MMEEKLPAEVRLYGMLAVRTSWPYGPGQYETSSEMGEMCGRCVMRASYRAVWLFTHPKTKDDDASWVEISHFEQDRRIDNKERCVNVVTRMGIISLFLGMPWIWLHLVLLPWLARQKERNTAIWKWWWTRSFAPIGFENAFMGGNDQKYVTVHELEVYTAKDWYYEENIFMALAPFVDFRGCESLEDTYKDYAGDGPIRYLVKCDDLDVKAGWNRLVVSWKSVDDPIIDKVKVSWTVDGIGRDTLLERGTFACSPPCDGNLTYQVSVANMDKNGNTSLAVTQVGRPYSPEHEQVLIFPTMVNKHFMVQDRLALVLDEWGNQIDSIAFVYTSAGQGKRTVMKAHRRVFIIYWKIKLMQRQH